MLASPDIDIDVFRREIAEIDQSRKPPSITLFVSQDDKALGLSKLIAGGESRVGAVDPTRDPYKSILERARVRVVDLTALSADDPANHSKFASEDVVRSIGARLAGGQTMSDGKQTFGETLGSIAINATKGVGATAAGMATGSLQEVNGENAKPAKGDAEPLVK
jgi:esterase/lipase superfamily enzyme